MKKKNEQNEQINKTMKHNAMCHIFTTKMTNLYNCTYCKDTYTHSYTHKNKIVFCHIRQSHWKKKSQNTNGKSITYPLTYVTLVFKTKSVKIIYLPQNAQGKN